MTGDQLKAARQAMGLTQEGLARRLGVRGHIVARKERGERPINGIMAAAVRGLVAGHFVESAAPSIWRAVRGRVARVCGGDELAIPMPETKAPRGSE